MIDLDELMKLREAATPGPWYATHDINGDIAPFVEGTTGWVFGEGFDPIDGESYMRPSFNDLEYIVAACNAMPELVARIRELEAEIKRRDAYKLAEICNACTDDSFCPYIVPCPFGNKKRGDITPEDWLLWMYEEEKNGN